MNALTFQAWLENSHLLFYWLDALHRRDAAARAYVARVFARNRPGRLRLQAITGGCPLV